jgi:hypothetical protein
MYTNVDSFVNKFEEFQERYIKTRSVAQPDIIAICEVLPKNRRYVLSLTEFSLEDYLPGELSRLSDVLSCTCDRISRQLKLRQTLQFVRCVRGCLSR